MKFTDAEDIILMSTKKKILFHVDMLEGWGSYYVTVISKAMIFTSYFSHSSSLLKSKQNIPLILFFED